MASLPLRKKSRRRWLLRLGIGVATALLTFETAFQYRWRSVQAERDGLIAQLREAGEPVFWDDLEKPQTEGSKALREALAAFGGYAATGRSALPMALNTWQRLLYPADVSTGLQTLLDEKRNVLPLLERAVDLPAGQLREPIDGNNWGTMDCWLHDARDCDELLCAAVREALQRDAARDAYRTLIVRFKLIRALEADLTAQLWLSAFADRTVHELVGVLARAVPTFAETPVLDAHLAGLAARSTRAPLSEMRAMAMTPLETTGDLNLKQFWNGIQVRRPAWTDHLGPFHFAASLHSFYSMRWGRPSALEEQATLLRTTAEAQAAIDDVGPEADSRWEEMNRRHTEEIECCLWLRCLHYPQSWTSQRRATLQLRRNAILARYALRANQFRIRTGKLPASFNDFANEISPLESSPFFPGGKPTYRREGNGFVLGEAVVGEEPPNDEQRPVLRVTYLHAIDL